MARVTVGEREFGWGKDVLELPLGVPFDIDADLAKELVHAAHDHKALVYHRTGPSTKRPYLIEDGKRRPLLVRGTELLNVVELSRGIEG